MDNHNDNILNSEQAAALLEVSVSCLHQWCRANKVPHKKLGVRMVCFVRDDLVEFKKTLARPVSEIDQLRQRLDTQAQLLDDLEAEIQRLKEWRISQTSLLAHLTGEHMRRNVNQGLVTPISGQEVECDPPDAHLKIEDRPAVVRFHTPRVPGCVCNGLGHPCTPCRDARVAT